MTDQDKTVYFDMRVPAGCDATEYYLSLVDFLAHELMKHTKVEIINEQILDNFKLQQEIKSAEIMAKTYQQKADLLKRHLGD